MHYASRLFLFPSAGASSPKGIEQSSLIPIKISYLSAPNTKLRTDLGERWYILMNISLLGNVHKFCFVLFFFHLLLSVIVHVFFTLCRCNSYFEVTCLFACYARRVFQSRTHFFRGFRYFVVVVILQQVLGWCVIGNDRIYILSNKTRNNWM